MQAVGIAKKKAHTEHYTDYSLIFIIFFLLGFGLVMLYSTSSYEAALQFGSGTYYFRHQLVSTLIGLVFMFVIMLFPYQNLKIFAFPVYFMSMILIMLVKTSLGWSSHGASRWIRIMGVSIQPAEVAKAAMIIFIATFIDSIGRGITTRKGFLMVLALPLPVCAMVYLITKNLSSAVIIFGIALLMLFISTPGYKKAIIFIALTAAAAAAVVAFISKSGPGDSWRFERVLAWLDPEAYASGKGFQTLQSLYAIGSGGVFGKGLGESMQKLGFIPEAQNDMIFSIICEELGLFGAISVIMMFVLLLWRMMLIANSAPDLYGALLVIGVMGHLSIQVVLNIAVVTNTIPNTGITLPFISYGGSAVVLLLSEIGLVLSVARRIEY